MQGSWMPICLVPHKEVDWFINKVPDVFRLVSFECELNQLRFAYGPAFDQDLDVETVFRDTLVSCSMTAGGKAEQLRLAQIWTERFGAAPPPHIDLSDGVATADLSRYILPSLMQSWRESQAQGTAVMRALAQLRGSFDQSQTAFAKLESFLYNSGRAERTQTVSLRHRPGREGILLAQGLPVEQRLPIESVGLCDIAFLVETPPQCAGTLTAQLDLLESAEMVAQWTIRDADLESDWIRLSLPRALGADAQTPVLRLDWDGPAPLRLAASFYHPDARFRATGSSAVMALNLWTYISGATAPLPAQGVPPDGATPADRWHIGALALRDAINLNFGDDLVEFTEWRGSLTVRPVGRKPSGVRLNNAGRPGLLSLRGGVKTEAAFGPEVEYGFAFAPKSRRGTQRGHLPEFSARMMSEWVRLRPGEWADLHFFLEHPLEEVCDLYLLSRLTVDQPPAAPVDACFYPLTGQA